MTKVGLTQEVKDLALKLPTEAPRDRESCVAGLIALRRFMTAFRASDAGKACLVRTFSDVNFSEIIARLREYIEDADNINYTHLGNVIATLVNHCVRVLCLRPEGYAGFVRDYLELPWYSISKGAADAVPYFRHCSDEDIATFLDRWGSRDQEIRALSSVVLDRL